MISKVKFKDFVDYDKRIGKMIITGLEGSGKTMLLARIAIGKMLHGMQDCWKSYSVVDTYNELGFNFSTNYEHLCFSNFGINCSGTKIPDRHNYVVNPYRLGLFDPLYETDYFPPYACHFLTEAYNFLNSYLYNKFRDSFKAFLKTCRQAKYDMVVDTHSFMDIFTGFRRLTNRFIYLYAPVQDIKDDRGVVVGHKLFVKEWRNNRDVEIFESSGKEINCETYDLILDKCMFENYDTEFCKYLHLQGRENQDFFITEFPKVCSKEDIDNIGERFGILPPEGFFKTSSNKKVESESSDVDEDESDNDIWNF